MKISTASLQSFSRLNLRAKVSLGVILPMLIILIFFTAIEYGRHKAFMFNDLSLLASHSGRIVESNLGQAMLNSDFVELQGILDSIGKTEEFRVVYLLNTSGRVIFSPEEKNVGLQLDNLQPDCQPCHHLPPEERPGSVVVTANNGERVFRSMQVIENRMECMGCHDLQERIIGLLLTDIPMGPLEASLKEHITKDILWWGSTIFVVVIAVNLVIDRFVLRRLEKLSRAIKGFGHGHMPNPLTNTSGDEIGQLSLTFNEMTRQVEARNIENNALSESLRRQNEQRGELLKRIITIQEEERKRVARELHDELGQYLTGLSFKVAAAQQKINSNPELSQKELTQTQRLIQETVDKMYDMILTLRPSVLDDMGLAAALQSHAERTFRGTGIDIKVEYSEMPGRLPAAMETTLYRIFQEAIQNIVRHSKATSVHIKLISRDGLFEGVVSDNGQGFDLKSVPLDGSKVRGLGLMGMQERIELVSGHLEIITQPGCGTTLQILVPIKEAYGG